MDPVSLFLALAALVVGGVAGYLLASSRAAGARTTAAAREASLTSRLGSEESARTTAERTFSERLASEQRTWSERQCESERRHVRALAEAEERHAEEVSRLERAFEAERTRLATEADKRITELRADTKRISDEFDALSKKALAANAEAFLAQAEERLKRTQVEQSAELAKREEAVKSLVAPLEKTLSLVKEEMTTAEKSRLQAHAALSAQVQGMKESSEQLRTETNALVTALRAPQVRGQWGELQLRRTVEAAGMVDHVDFDEQVQLDGGAKRPDLVVSLPDGKQVVVDAKVAFNGYLEAQEARDDATRSERLAAHARHLRTHIDQLAAKEYWSHLDSSPEFTVMFVPAEVFLDEALKQDPTLLEHAFSKNVVLATPTTLVTLLRTVAYTWRQEQLATEAKQVFTVGRELHKRLAIFGGHLDQLAKKLNGTVVTFNKMTSSLDSRVVPQMQRFSALQGLDAGIEVPPPLEVMATAPQKPDLYQVEAGATEPAKPVAIDPDAERRAVLGERDSLDDHDLLAELAAIDESGEVGKRRRA